MGCSPFKTCSTNPSAPAPNPDPSRWRLIRKHVFPNAYVLHVQYSDCINCNGEKIMVFEGRYKHRDYLDPHFNWVQGDSPIARFRPGSRGWIMAIALAESLNDLKQKGR